jgi:putative addiction module killer protein
MEIITSTFYVALMDASFILTTPIHNPLTFIVLKRIITMYEIRHYLTTDGFDVFQDWLTHLRDKLPKMAVIKRVNRVEAGNFGDHKFCRDGVWELRVDVGPGYRVYYALAGKQVVLLLCGGDKSSQGADIDKACAYWKDWQNR